MVQRAIKESDNLKVKLIQKELSDALSVVSKATPSNPTIPILSGIKLEVKDNELTLYSTDLEIGIIAKLNCEADGEISKIIPSDLFKKYINNLSAEQFELEIKDKKLHIKADGKNMELNVYNANEFPKIQTIKNINFKIGQSKLKHLLEKTNFAVAQGNEENRNALNGLRLEIKDNRMIAVGTNTYRLSYKNVEIDEDLDLKTTLPFETIKILTKLLDNDEVNIIFDKSMVRFQLGKYEITSRTIAGEYPNYEQVLPEQYNTIVKVDKNEFKTAIKRTKLFDENGVINIELNDTVKITEIKSDIGHNLEEIECENFDGDKMDINLDAQYILDSIKKVDSETVLLKGISKLKPFDISDELDDSWISIVMPVRGNE